MSTGVLVMAYGTPRDLDDVEGFYTDVRRGRPPSEAQLTALVDRYRAIGGVSPLNERTAAQAAALERALVALGAPGDYVLRYGAKHAHPNIEEAVEGLSAAGSDQLVGLVLAPHYSSLSIGEYLARAAKRAGELDMAYGFVEAWYDEPALVDALAERVRAGATDLVTRHGEPLEVVFTAHSLPERIRSTDDPYPAQLAETARLVAAAANIRRYRTGWQSAGRTAEAWLGPDITEILPALAEEGVASVLVCPAGFTSDHLEILYDLDIEASALARRLGVGFARTASLNDDPAVMGALARRIATVAAALGR